MIVLTELTLEAVDLAAKIINTSRRRLDEGHDNVDCDHWSMVMITMWTMSMLVMTFR